MGGKPSKGTKKDRRLKGNRGGKKRAAILRAVTRPFASTRSADGRFPI